MNDVAVGHIEEDDLQPAQTTSLDVTFAEPYPAGTLELSCHIGEHYQKGRHLPIESRRERWRLSCSIKLGGIHSMSNSISREVGICRHASMSRHGAVPSGT